jgi:hypothetical protein
MVLGAKAMWPAPVWHWACRWHDGSFGLNTGGYHYPPSVPAACSDANGGPQTGDCHLAGNCSCGTSGTERVPGNPNEFRKGSCGPSSHSWFAHAFWTAYRDCSF